MMREIWEVPGQYSLEIPKQWSVVEREDVVELTPENGDAAVHISVNKKTTIAQATPKEAICLLENFASRSNLTPTDSGVNVQAQDCGFSGVGHYTGAIDDPTQPAIWIVRTLVGAGVAVICSLCLDDMETTSYADGLAILKSVKLEQGA